VDPEIKSAGFAELPPETAYRLWQLRTAVFVVEQACAYQELDGRDLEPTTRHFWTDDGAGAVAAYLRLLVEPSGDARIGRVCVARPARAGGLGRLLMNAAHDEVGSRDVVVDAQSHLAHWYAELGYVMDGPEFVEDGIPHVPMRRTVRR
jgi:ElaA protein